MDSRRISIADKKQLHSLLICQNNLKVVIPLISKSVDSDHESLTTFSIEFVAQIRIPTNEDITGLLLNRKF